MLDYAIRINDVSAIALTKIDVLSGLDQIKVCTAYEYNGKEIKDFPANMRLLSECKPIFDTLKGWGECSKHDWLSFLKIGYDSMPRNLRNYIDYIEKQTGIPVSLISFGPDRAFTMSHHQSPLDL